MRSIALLMSIIFCTLFIVRVDAVAGVLDYTAGSGGQAGSCSADAAVKRIGKLNTRNGHATLSGNKIDLLFENADLTQKLTLTGTTFQTQRTDHKTIEGLVYFNGGSDVHELGTSNEDYLSSTRGDQYHGTITSVDDSGVTIQTADGAHVVPLDSMKTIHSSRVFKFSIPFTADTITGGVLHASTSNIAFWETATGTTLEGGTKSTGAQAATTKSNVSTIATRQPWSTKTKVIVAMITLLIIGTAIAVPIAVAVGTHGHSHGPSLAEQRQLLQNIIASHAGAGAGAP